MEATPGIEIQGKRLHASRLDSNGHSITQLQRSKSRLSPGFPLSVHGVVPNSYQVTRRIKSSFYCLAGRYVWSQMILIFAIYFSQTISGNVTLWRIPICTHQRGIGFQIATRNDTGMEQGGLMLSDHSRLIIWITTRICRQVTDFVVKQSQRWF